MALASEPPAATPFHAEVTIIDHTVWLICAGELDATNAEQIVDIIDEHLSNPAVTDVVADLAGLDFLGSAGLAALVSGRRHANELGKTFRVQGAQGFIAHTIDTTGLTRYLADPSFTPETF